MLVINILVDSNLQVSLSSHCWFFLKQLAARPGYHVIGAHQAPNKLGSVLGLFFFVEEGVAKWKQMEQDLEELERTW